MEEFVRVVETVRKLIWYNESYWTRYGTFQNMDTVQRQVVTHS